MNRLAVSSACLSVLECFAAKFAFEGFFTGVEYDMPLELTQSFKWSRAYVANKFSHRLMD